MDDLVKRLKEWSHLPHMQEAIAALESLQAREAALVEALKYGIGCAKNELVARGLPLEWSENSGIGVMERALSLTPAALLDRRKKEQAVIESARKLKFGAYPAHGSGFVLIVTEGNVDDLSAALAALSETPDAK